MLPVWLATGCSLAVDPERSQCFTDNDCRAQPASLAAGVCIDGLCSVSEGWSCLHDPLADTSVESVASIPLFDQGGAAEPLAAEQLAEVRLCEAADIECLDPVERRSPSMLELQRLPELVFELPEGFQGYAELEVPGRVPLMYFLQAPFSGDRPLPAATLMTQSGLGQLAGAVDADIGSERGALMVQVQDCEGQGSAGLHYESPALDDSAVRFYMVGGVPSVEATATDPSGRGGFLNLPAGPLLVTAAFAEQAPAALQQAFLIRPGWITYARLLPAGFAQSTELTAPRSER